MSLSAVVFIHTLSYSTSGGRPRNVQVLERAGADVKERTTLFRSVSDKTIKILNMLDNESLKPWQKRDLLLRTYKSINCCYIRAKLS